MATHDRRFQTFICDSKAVDAENGIYDLMPSTESEDRDGDILLALGARLDNFRKNPVVLYAHRYSDLPVAKCLSIEALHGKGLKARIQFPEAGVSEQADVVHALWRGGFLNAASVGFLPFTWSDRPKGDDAPQGVSRHNGRIYTDWELLEFSIVPVPSNQDALRLAIKQLGEGTGSVGAILEEMRVIPLPVRVRQLDVSSEQKRGRVLSAVNEKRIRDAVSGLTQVLSQLDEEPGADDEGKAVKGAIAPHTSPKADADTVWDAGEVVRELPNEASVLRLVHAWADGKADPDAKGAYKFPHHLADGRVVLRGVNNAKARLPGSSIPADDKPGVERHLNVHQAQFTEEEAQTDWERALRELFWGEEGNEYGTGESALDQLTLEGERDLASSLEMLLHQVKEAIAP